MSEKKVIEPEIVDPMVDVIKRSGMEESSAVALRGQFAEYYDKIVSIRAEAETVTDPEDQAHQKVARTVRLALKAQRVEVNKVRKSLKAESLSRSKAIDGFANVLKYLCEPIEAEMLRVEQHAALKEAARVAAVIEDRTKALTDIGADPSMYKIDAIDDDAFATLLGTVKQAQELQAESDRKVEADRVATEKKEKDARDALEAENKKLRDDKAEADALKLKEDQAKEAADAEIEKDRKAAEAEKLKAEQAPDKEKIEAFAVSAESLLPIEMTTPKGAAVMNDIRVKQAGFVKWIRSQAETL